MKKERRRGRILCDPAVFFTRSAIFFLSSSSIHVHHTTLASLYRNISYLKIRKGLKKREKEKKKIPVGFEVVGGFQEMVRE